MPDNSALLLDFGKDDQGNIITVTGESFSKQSQTGVADSIQAVEEAELVKPATYHLIHGRALAKKDNPVWSQWHDTNAERDTVLDAEGIMGEKGALYVVEFQNGGMWIGDHQRIRSAVNDRALKSYAMPLEQEEVNILLDAIKKGDTAVLKEKGWVATDNNYAFASAEAFMEESGRTDFLRDNPAYVVLRTAEKARKDLRGYHDTDQQKDNVSLIIPAGGKAPLARMIERSKSFGWKQFGSHNDGYTNANSGRVVFLYSDDSGVVAYNYFDNDGRSVGVAPEALVARSKIVQPLDQIVAEQEANRIPELDVRRLLTDEIGYTPARTDTLMKVLTGYTKQ